MDKVMEVSDRMLRASYAKYTNWVDRLLLVTFVYNTTP